MNVIVSKLSECAFKTILFIGHQSSRFISVKLFQYSTLWVVSGRKLVLISILKKTKVKLC